MSRQGLRSESMWQMHTKQKWTCLPPRRQPTNPIFTLTPPAVDSMVQMWLSLHLCAFPPKAGSSSKGSPGQSSPPSSGSTLAGPSLVWGPSVSPGWHSLGDHSLERSCIPSKKYIYHPLPEIWNLCVWANQLIDSGLLAEVAETILVSRAPSTRALEMA